MAIIDAIAADGGDDWTRGPWRRRAHRLLAGSRVLASVGMGRLRSLARLLGLGLGLAGMAELRATVLRLRGCGLALGAMAATKSVF